MSVPNGVEGSWEEALHNAGASNQYLMFTRKKQRFFPNVIGHRAIGVVYHPEYERHGNYITFTSL